MAEQLQGRVALVTGGWNNFLIWLVTTFNFDGTLL